MFVIAEYECDLDIDVSMILAKLRSWYVTPSF